MEELLVTVGWVSLGVSIGGLVMWFKESLKHNKSDHDRIEKKLDDHAESEGHKLTEMGHDIKEIRNGINKLVELASDK